MRTISYLAAAAMAATVIFSACKKDETSDNKTGAERKTTLVANEWLVTNLTVNGADSTSTLKPCRKDNVWKFSAANVFTVDEGATKCDPANSNTFDAGTYLFTSDYDSVTVTSPAFTFGLPFKANVTEFKANTFSIQIAIGPITQKVQYTKK